MESYLQKLRHYRSRELDHCEYRWVFNQIWTDIQTNLQSGEVSDELDEVLEMIRAIARDEGMDLPLAYDYYYILDGPTVNPDQDYLEWWLECWHGCWQGCWRECCSTRATYELEMRRGMRF